MKINRILPRYFNRKILSTVNKDELHQLFSDINIFKSEYQEQRYGNDDGGYVIPNDLKGVSDLFSPGVSNSISFEMAVFNKIKCDVHLLDATISKPINLPSQFKYYDYLLKGYDSEINKHLSLESWFKLVDKPVSTNNILQMDIEGDEYEVLLNTSNYILSQFRIVVIEFHSIDMILEKNGYHIFRTVVKKLLDKHYIYHIHPNNCCGVYKYKGLTIPSVLEFTFHKRDRVNHILPASYPYKSQYDKKNIDTIPDIVLTPEWVM